MALGLPKILPRLKAAARAFTDPPEQWDGHKARQSFEGAQTNRLNQAQWATADARDINTIIEQDLPTLRTRSRYEGRNNPFVRGVMETYAHAVVGPEGPALQIECDSSKQFADALEKAWRNFSDDGDTSRDQTLPDLLSLQFRGLWDSGEFLLQHYLSPDGVRVNDIDPARLNNAGLFTAAADGNHMIMGVERTKYGKAVRYFIQGEQYGYGGAVPSGEYQAVNADFIIHGRQTWYPNQVRGVPWLAPALDSIGHAREYDRAVLEAAKTAAKLSLWLENPNSEGAALTAPDFYEIEAGMAATGPPGWVSKQLKAEQPTAQYKDLQNEYLRRIGRAKGVPLMLVRLDAADHTYSSARFDAQIFQVHARADQAWLRRTELEPLLRRVAQFVAITEFKGQIPEYRANWIFNAIPHVDPLKEAMAERVQLENGTLTLSEVCASRGIDLDAHIERMRREMAAIEAAGLPLRSYAGKIASDTEVSAVLGETDGGTTNAQPTKAA